MTSASSDNRAGEKEGHGGQGLLTSKLVIE